MTPPTLIIYDDGPGRLGPLTATRAVFEVRTGAVTTLQRIRRAMGNTACVLSVPERLRAVVRARFTDATVNPDRCPSGPCLLVNGRWLGHRFVQEVQALSINRALVQTDGGVVAALLDAPDADAFLRSGCLTLPDKANTVRAQERLLVDRPWHILDALTETLLDDLNTCELPVFDAGRHPGVTVFGQHTLRVAPDALLMPASVIDTSQGPVVVDRDAVVHPLAVLQGPCYVGPASTVVSHASVRPNSVVGPGCKVGGEVSASILQAYSNKSHSGYLGDSLVGAWVNLGAGTNTSNLKNTYGNVRVQLDDTSPAEDTGRLFHGAIIGDFVRTAIGARLPTGAVIHTGCMLGGCNWAPKLAMPLGFYDDHGRHDYDPSKLRLTIQRITQRRGVTLAAEEIDLVLSLRRR